MQHRDIDSNAYIRTKVKRCIFLWSLANMCFGCNICFAIEVHNCDICIYINTYISPGCRTFLVFVTKPSHTEKDAKHISIRSSWHCHRHSIDARRLCILHYACHELLPKSELPSSLSFIPILLLLHVLLVLPSYLFPLRPFFFINQLHKSRTPSSPTTKSVSVVAFVTKRRYLIS